MGHDVRDTLKYYWFTVEQFYSNRMKCDLFYCILKFLHFSDNMNQPDKNDNKYDRPLKMRTLFDQLNDAYAKFYNPSECSAMDEVIMLFKGRVLFKQYTPKKHKYFGIKI